MPWHNFELNEKSCISIKKEKWKRIGIFKNMNKSSTVIYVLDTSAFFAMQDLPQEVEFAAPPRVMDELKKFGDRRAEYWEFRIKIMSPSPESIKKTTDQARRTGDIHRLSETDLEVLALAYDLDGIIMTDDYSIQNVAKTMNISYVNLNTKGITEVYKWVMKCEGCGRTFREEIQNCPICGCTLKCKRVRKKKK